MFILVNFSVIILRETSAQWYRPTYQSPLYPYMQLFGIISGIILLIFLGLLPLLAILVISLIGLIIYFTIGKHASRTGVLRKYSHRPALYLLYSKKGRKERLRRKERNYKNVNLDGKLISKAGVVVPLLGNENSPEMLVEIGAALNKKEKIQVINITEVPNQALLDAFMEENPKITSLERRISGLAKSKNIDIDFEAAVTHDLSNTIYQLSEQTSCDWLVMSWNGRAHSGILVSNPLGWLLTHIDSDFALFKDNGVRYFGKILLAMRPGRKDKNFVAIADRICNFYNASLTLLHIVPEDMSDLEFKKIEDSSRTTLSKATSKSEVIIQRSKDAIGAISKISAEYDLLILGTPQKDNWLNILFGPGKDKFADSSACSVLRLTVKD
jgi:hypothetical protein